MFEQEPCAPMTAQDPTPPQSTPCATPAVPLAQTPLPAQNSAQNPGRTLAENSAQADRTVPTTQGQTPSAAYNALLLPGALEADATAFKALAQELGLPLESAQKLADLQAQIATSAHARQSAEREDILSRWQQEAKETFGPRYQNVTRGALRAAEHFGGEELRELLDVTGLGTHPVVIKTFHAVATQMAEDECLGGTPTRSSDRTFAEALYGEKLN